MNGSNERAAGEMVEKLVKVYQARIDEMLADPEKMNVSLLKEAREFLKQYDIEIDPVGVAKQDLEDVADGVSELETHRARRAAHASIARG